MLSPLVVVGALAGRAFLRRIPQRAFRGAVLALTAAASIVLLVF